jgi:adenylate cyclase
VLVVNIASYAHWFRGDFDQAIACNHRALQLNPGGADRFWAMGGLSRAHLAAGRVEEGLLWALRSLDVNGDRIFTHCIVVACYALLGRMEQAHAALAVVLAKRPNLTIASVIDPGPRDGDVPLVAGLKLAGLPGEVRLKNN